jgi:hypothetical protein
MRMFRHGEMFPKLNLNDREIYRKHTIAHHDSISFMYDHFDRRFGINHYIDGNEFFGVSGHESLVSKKHDLIDMERYNAGKAV